MANNLVFGVGLNDSILPVSIYKNGKQIHCKAYNRWKAILQRCFSQKFKLKHPTYADCEICNEWLTFSNFKLWLCSHDKWEDLCIDKDILIEGNKIYSPDTCVMVPAWVNNFIIEPVVSANGLMNGVAFNRKSMKFQARVNNRWTGKKEHLGYFDNEIDAHLKWKHRKLEILRSVKELIDDNVYESLERRFL